jgi:hypothetical protein
LLSSAFYSRTALASISYGLELLVAIPKIDTRTKIDTITCHKIPDFRVDEQESLESYQDVEVYGRSELLMLRKDD